MLTPVGGCAAQTAASIRGGISAYQKSVVYNRQLEPMTLALVPEEALAARDPRLDDTVGLESALIRMLRLAQPALDETLEHLPKAQDVPLLLATRECGVEKNRPLTEEFLQRLSSLSNRKFHIEDSALFPEGRAGFMFALQAALEYLQEEKYEYVLAGGVDTFLDLHLLGSLDLEGRVLADGVMDGFAPGEGAAFLLLASAGALRRDALTSFAEIHPPGIAYEEGHRYSTEPYRGDGLATAVRAAVRGDSTGLVRSAFGSLNGENFGAKEWGVAWIRNKERFAEPLLLEYPADCFGDTGAAAGAILTGLAAIGTYKGYLPGPTMVWCSAETGYRAAALIASMAQKVS